MGVHLLIQSGGSRILSLEFYALTVSWAVIVAPEKPSVITQQHDLCFPYKRLADLKTVRKLLL